MPYLLLIHFLRLPVNTSAPKQQVVPIAVRKTVSQADIIYLSKPPEEDVFQLYSFPTGNFWNNLINHVLRYIRSEWVIQLTECQDFYSKSYSIMMPNVLKNSEYWKKRTVCPFLEAASSLQRRVVVTSHHSKHVSSTTAWPCASQGARTWHK